MPADVAPGSDAAEPVRRADWPVVATVGGASRKGCPFSRRGSLIDQTEYSPFS